MRIADSIKHPLSFIRQNSYCEADAFLRAIVFISTAVVYSCFYGTFRLF